MMNEILLRAVKLVLKSENAEAILEKMLGPTWREQLEAEGLR